MTFYKRMTPDFNPITISNLDPLYFRRLFNHSGFEQINAFSNKNFKNIAKKSPVKIIERNLNFRFRHVIALLK